MRLSCSQQTIPESGVQMVQRGFRVSSCCGFTILELLICMGIILLLLAILLPALDSARESARRIQCNDHLKQLGFALHHYHEMNGFFPPGWQWDARQETVFGWLPPLLPYLEQNNLHLNVNYQEAVSGPLNALARARTPANFLCPSDMTQPRFMLYKEANLAGPSRDVGLVLLPSASYLGVFGVEEPDDTWRTRAGAGIFGGPAPVRIQDIQRGLSLVIMVGERRASTIPSTWLGIDIRGEDAHCRILGNADLGPNVRHADECEFTSRHPGMVNFLWADGHVKSISNSIESSIYRQMATATHFTAAQFAF